MRALVWKEKDTIVTEERPLPNAGKDEAIIRVGCAGICGSDLTIIAGKHPRAKAPLILGHEFMGTIEALPSFYGGKLKAGMRVTVEPLISCGNCRPCREGHGHVCRNLKLLGVETDGAFADYVSVPLTKVYPLNDSITDEEGAMMEPLAVAVHAVDTGKIKPGESVIVFGAGPIGLLCALVAKAQGHEKVMIYEIDGKRIVRARNLGLNVVDTSRENAVEAALNFTNGDGADVTIDAAGVPAVGASLIPVTGIKGRIVIVALYKNPCEVFFRQLSYSEQSIYGTRIYAQGDYEAALCLVRDKKISLTAINTHTFKWDGIDDAFRIAKDPSESCKVLVKI
jgi:2-desacetyl-2-hydroxyethyl bacteriochlorophyllide A dehydrogenase